MTHPRMSERLMPALAALACALLIFGAVPAFAAQPPEPDRIAFGLVGIAFGQAVQVSVANTRLSEPPEPEAPPIAAEIVFLDGDGSVFKRSVQTVATGHSATLTLARGELSPRGGRAMVRALVRFGQPPDPDAIGRALPVAATLEVVDVVTGRTSFALQAPPEPD